MSSRDIDRLYADICKVTPASEQSIWAIEASHWRLPYWDWAADQPYLQNVGVPQLFTLPQVTVVMPNSKSATVNNPLWKFSNPKGVAMGDKSMQSWAITAQPVSLIDVKLVLLHSRLLVQYRHLDK